MMTIITPLGGSALYEMSAEFSYPKILNEIDKKTLFEYSQEIVAGLPTDTRRIFLIPGQKDKALQLSSMIAIVSNGQGKVIHLQGDTGGAVCSCLLAVDDIDPDDEVIIISAVSFSELFGREAPVVLEIGFGMGASLVSMAQHNPHQDFFGIEVHAPGVGACLASAHEAGISNLRVMCHDAMEVLETMIPRPDEEIILMMRLLHSDR